MYFESKKETLIVAVDERLNEIQDQLLSQPEEQVLEEDDEGQEYSDIAYSDTDVEAEEVGEDGSRLLKLQKVEIGSTFSEDSARVPLASTVSASSLSEFIRTETKRAHDKNEGKRASPLQDCDEQEDEALVDGVNDEDVEEIEDGVPKDWWKAGSESFIAEQPLEEEAFLKLGNKIMAALSLLALSVNNGEKMLLFTQSLPMLNLLEMFLATDWGALIGIPYTGSMDNASASNGAVGFRRWRKDVDFLRIDGSVEAEERQTLIRNFNRNLESKLFIISTKAGNMGINLQAATRVLILDASFNPVHDLQAIFRAYRFGQKKTVFVYRFLSSQTMVMVFLPATELFPYPYLILFHRVAHRRRRSISPKS